MIVILLICVILQEIQLIFLRKAFAEFQEVFTNAIVDGVKVKIKFPIDPKEDGNDNTGA